MALGLLAGALAGAGDAGEKSGLLLQKQWGEERLQQMKADAEKELQTGLETMRQTGQNTRLATTESGLSTRQAAQITSTEGIHNADRTSRENEGLANRSVQREHIGLERDRLEEQSRHNKAYENIQAAAEGRLAKGANLDNSLKQIGLDNAKRVEKLKTEFSAATPERKKAITDEIQLITGKDNDKYLPVPLKDEQGNVTGYKIFDTKRGEWVDGKEAKSPPTSAHVDALKKRGNDPAAKAAFDAQFGAGAADRALGAGAPATDKPTQTAQKPGYADELDRLKPRPKRPIVDLQGEDKMMYP